MADEHQAALLHTRWNVRIRPAVLPLLAAPGILAAAHPAQHLAGTDAADLRCAQDPAQTAARERQTAPLYRPARQLPANAGRPRRTNAAHQPRPGATLHP